MAAMRGARRNAPSSALRENEGVITRAQAAGCGLSPGEIRHRIRPGGPWQRLLPGVYLVVTGTTTRRQREIAALRRAGPGRVLSRTTAIEHHGVRPPGSTDVTVLVPAAQRRRSEGFARIWPTTRMPEFVFTDGAIQFTEA